MNNNAKPNASKGVKNVKNVFGKAVTLSMAAAISIPVFVAPVAASAQDYHGYNNDTQCQQSVNNNSLAGGVIGAGIGAITGSQMSGRNHRTDGSVLGAVVGAVIGSQVGKARVACDDQYQYQRRSYESYGYAPRGPVYPQRDSYYERSDYDRSGYYSNDDYYQGRSVSYNPPYNYSANQCGWGTAAYKLPNGRLTHEQVYMCKQGGRWVVTGR